MLRPFITLVTLALLGTLGVSAGVPAQAPSGAAPLRVVSYNIHHGEGMDQIFDLQRVAGVILATQPDLVALQEVDQATERSSGVNQATELGRLTGMYVAFGKAMEYMGGEYGVAVLSRWPFLQVDNRALPRDDNFEPRTALTVQVQPNPRGPRLLFTSTHLDSGREAPNRLAQAQQLNALLANDDRTPSILAGDLNSRAETDVMQTLRSLWNDMFVEPPPDPGVRFRMRVDHVLARPLERWRSVESRAIDTPLVSDHWPVLAVLELDGSRD